MHKLLFDNNISHKILSQLDGSLNKKYVQGSQKELIEFCNKYFKSDTEIEKYCKSKNIPMTLED